MSTVHQWWLHFYADDASDGDFGTGSKHNDDEPDNRAEKTLSVVLTRKHANREETPCKTTISNDDNTSTFEHAIQSYRT